VYDVKFGRPGTIGENMISEYKFEEYPTVVSTKISICVIPEAATVILDDVCPFKIEVYVPPFILYFNLQPVSSTEGVMVVAPILELRTV
jgi:hypothetical protein